MKTRYYLGIILILALILRLYGLDSGLPYLYQSDENFVFEIALNIGNNLRTQHNLMPMNYYYEGINLAYPTFLPTLLTLVYGFLFILGLWDVTPQEIAARSLQPNETTLLFMAGRLIIVMMSIATIYLIYLIGKREYNEKTGLLSALFLSVIMVHVRYSHWFITDIPLVFWITLCFYYTTFILKEGKLKYYIYAGIAAGFATGTKYNGFLIFFVILAAHLLREKDRLSSKNELLRLLFDNRIFISLGATVGVFLITTPYALLAFDEFKHWTWAYQRGHLYKSQWGWLGWYRGTEVGWIYHLKSSLVYGMGLPLAVLALLGVLYAIWNHKTEDMLPLAWTISFYLLIGSWNTKSNYYVLPIIPFLALFAGRFSADILERVKEKRAVRILAIFIIGLIFMSALLQSLMYVNILAQADTRTEAARWISQNAETSSLIVVHKGYGHFTIPRINETKYAVKELNLQEFIEYTETNDNRADYLILSNYNYRYIVKFHEPPAQAEFIRDLFDEELKYSLVKEFQNKPNFMGYEVEDSFPPEGILISHPTISIFKKE